jgi:redox-regulated HSP33 family molecular chaperone
MQDVMHRRRQSVQMRSHYRLADTIKAKELLELEHSTVLYRLFNEQPLRLYKPKALRFACSCSRKCTYCLSTKKKSSLY